MISLLIFCFLLLLTSFYFCCVIENTFL
jgi:hypothetical protein